MKRYGIIFIAIALSICLTSTSFAGKGAWDSLANLYHSTTWWNGSVFVINPATGDTLTLSSDRWSITDGTDSTWANKDTVSTHISISDTVYTGYTLVYHIVKTDTLDTYSADMITVVDTVEAQYAFIFDDGSGDSPKVILKCAGDKTFVFQKMDAGEANIINDEGAIYFKPSNDVDDYVGISTTSHLPEIQGIGGGDGANALKISTDDGHILIAPADDLELSPVGGDIYGTSATASKPTVKFTNTADDATAPTLTLVKDRATAGGAADQDAAGTIVFEAGDDGGTQRAAVSLIGTLEESASADAAGRLQVKVFHDDGSPAADNFLDMSGDNGTPGQGFIEFNADQKDIDFEVNASGASAFTVDAGTNITTFVNCAVIGDTLTMGTLVTPYARTVTVAKSGGDYATIQSAITYAATQTPAADENWTILIYPGVYDEAIAMSKHVNVRGVGPKNSVVITNTSTVVTFADSVEVQNLTVRAGDASEIYCFRDNGVACLAKVTDVHMESLYDGSSGWYAFWATGAGTYTFERCSYYITTSTGDGGGFIANAVAATIKVLDGDFYLSGATGPPTSSKSHLGCIATSGCTFISKGNKFSGDAYCNTFYAEDGTFTSSNDAILTTLANQIAGGATVTIQDGNRTYEADGNDYRIFSNLEDTTGDTLAWDATALEFWLTDDFSPRSGASYDLGSKDADWDTLFVDDIDVDANVTIGATVFAQTFDTNVAAAAVTLTATTLAADGTDDHINIAITPKGTGEVDITKVDIDAGVIDGTDIGLTSSEDAKFDTCKAAVFAGASDFVLGASGEDVTVNSDSIKSDGTTVLFDIDHDDLVDKSASEEVAGTWTFSSGTIEIPTGVTQIGTGATDTVNTNGPLKLDNIVYSAVAAPVLILTDTDVNINVSTQAEMADSAAVHAYTEADGDGRIDIVGKSGVEINMYHDGTDGNINVSSGILVFPAIDTLQADVAVITDSLEVQGNMAIGDATDDVTTVYGTITSDQTYATATTPFYLLSSLTATSGEHNNLRARAQSTAESASTSDIRGVYGQGIAYDAKYAGAVTGVFANAIAKNTSTSTHIRGLFAEAETEATPTAVVNLYGAYIRTKVHKDPTTDYYGVMIDNEEMATGFVADAYLGMKSTTWAAGVTSATYGIDMYGIAGLATADWRLRNGSLFNNSTADLLTITEATVDINGDLTAGSVTSDAGITATTTVEVGTVLTPDVSQGANIGADGTEFNLAWIDSVHANWFGGSDFELGESGSDITVDGDSIKSDGTTVLFDIDHDDLVDKSASEEVAGTWTFSSGTIELPTGVTQIGTAATDTVSFTGPVGIGTIAPDRRLHAEKDTSATATAVPIVRASVTSTGTPAAGFGPSYEFEIETAAGAPGNQEVIAAIDGIATDVSGGSEDGAVVFKTMKAGATATEDARFAQKALFVPETTTPNALATYGAYYTKDDNKPYFQDGAGNEREIATTSTFYAEMYFNNNGNAETIDTAAKPVLLMNFTTGSLNGFTFDAGRVVDADIANESDETQLGIETSAAHNLTSGDVVSQTGMNNAGHSGITTVTVTSATTYTCDDIAYVAGAGASSGKIVEGSHLIASAGSDGIYYIDYKFSITAVAAAIYKMQTYINSTACTKCITQRKLPIGDQGALGGGAFITVAATNKVYVAITCTDGTDDVTVQYGNVNLHRM